MSAFDMSKTLRHPTVVCERMRSVVENITYLRQQLADREAELQQLIDITAECWQPT